MTIRRATPADAEAIGELHVRAWQWAYAGLLPEDLLQGLADTLDRRIEARRADLTHEPPEQRTWIIEESGTVVGFAITGPTRDHNAAPQTGEVRAIYLRPDMVGRGIGRALFAHAVEDLRQRGYTQAMLWVLDTNTRGRAFYEAAGWTPDGASKTEQRADAVLREVRYRVALR